MSRPHPHQAWRRQITPTLPGCRWNTPCSAFCNRPTAAPSPPRTAHRRCPKRPAAARDGSAAVNFASDDDRAAVFSVLVGSTCTIEFAASSAPSTIAPSPIAPSTTPPRLAPRRADVPLLQRIVQRDFAQSRAAELSEGALRLAPPRPQRPDRAAETQHLVDAPLRQEPSPRTHPAPAESPAVQTPSAGDAAPLEADARAMRPPFATTSPVTVRRTEILSQTLRRLAEDGAPDRVQHRALVDRSPLPRSGALLRPTPPTSALVDANTSPRARTAQPTSMQPGHVGMASSALGADTLVAHRPMSAANLWSSSAIQRVETDAPAPTASTQPPLVEQALPPVAAKSAPFTRTDDDAPLVSPTMPALAVPISTPRAAFTPLELPLRRLARVFAPAESPVTVQAARLDLPTAPEVQRRVAQIPLSPHPAPPRSHPIPAPVTDPPAASRLTARAQRSAAAVTSPAETWGAALDPSLPTLPTVRRSPDREPTQRVASSSAQLTQSARPPQSRREPDALDLPTATETPLVDQILSRDFDDLRRRQLVGADVLTDAETVLPVAQGSIDFPVAQRDPASPAQPRPATPRTRRTWMRQLRRDLQPSVHAIQPSRQPVARPIAQSPNPPISQSPLRSPHWIAPPVSAAWPQTWNAFGEAMPLPFIVQRSLGTPESSARSQQVQIEPLPQAPFARTPWLRRLDGPAPVFVPESAVVSADNQSRGRLIRFSARRRSGGLERADTVQRLTADLPRIAPEVSSMPVLNEAARVESGAQQRTITPPAPQQRTSAPDTASSANLALVRLRATALSSASTAVSRESAALLSTPVESRQADRLGASSDALLPLAPLRTAPVQTQPPSTASDPAERERTQNHPPLRRAHAAADVPAETSHTQRSALREASSGAGAAAHSDLLSPNLRGGDVAQRQAQLRRRVPRTAAASTLPHNVNTDIVHHAKRPLVEGVLRRSFGDSRRRVLFAGPLAMATPTRDAAMFDVLRQAEDVSATPLTRGALPAQDLPRLPTPSKIERDANAASLVQPQVTSLPPLVLRQLAMPLGVSASASDNPAAETVPVPRGRRMTQTLLDLVDHPADAPGLPKRRQPSSRPSSAARLRPGAVAQRAATQAATQRAQTRVEPSSRIWRSPLLREDVLSGVGAPAVGAALVLRRTAANVDAGRDGAATSFHPGVLVAPTPPRSGRTLDEVTSSISPPSPAHFAPLDLAVLPRRSAEAPVAQAETLLERVVQRDFAGARRQATSSGALRLDDAPSSGRQVPQRPARVRLAKDSLTAALYARPRAAARLAQRRVNGRRFAPVSALWQGDGAPLLPPESALPAAPGAFSASSSPAAVLETMQAQGWRFKRVSAAGRPADVQRVAATAQSLSTLRGGDMPLPSQPRSLLERVLQRDFSGVRMQVAGLEPLGVAAAARGNTVYLQRETAANLSAPQNLALLGHELTHVAAAGHAPVQRQTVAPLASPSRAADASTRSALPVAATRLRGDTPPAAPAAQDALTPLVQRSILPPLPSTRPSVAVEERTADQVETAIRRMPRAAYVCFSGCGCAGGDAGVAAVAAADASTGFAGVGRSCTVAGVVVFGTIAVDAFAEPVYNPTHGRARRSARPTGWCVHVVGCGVRGDAGGAALSRAGAAQHRRRGRRA
ncbi:MAG: DUF4157 domain-containing protein [Caldilineaceae bacterium]